MKEGAGINIHTSTAVVATLHKKCSGQFKLQCKFSVISLNFSCSTKRNSLVQCCVYICMCPHFDDKAISVDLRVGEEGAEVEAITLPAMDRGGQLCSTFLRKAATTFPAICDTSGNGSSARVSTP